MNRNAQRIFVRNWKDLAKSNYDRACDYEEADNIIVAYAFNQIAEAYELGARMLEKDLQRREKGYARGESDGGDPSGEAQA